MSNKETTTRRNLAFFKRSGEPWTKEEYDKVINYVGDTGTITTNADTTRRLLFDDGTSSRFMHLWADQERHSHFENCTQVAYEDIFQEKEQPVETTNPFQAGDTVRSLTTRGSRVKGDLFTVLGVGEVDVCYKQRHAAHFHHFELVSRPEPKQEPRIAVVTKDVSGHPVDSRIIPVDNNLNSWKLYDNPYSPTYTHLIGNSCEWETNTTQVEPCSNQPQTQKEITMNLQEILSALFGAQKPATDYEKRPALLVIAYNRDGSQMATATASSIKDVKAKVAETPELWGCKVLTYALSEEVSVVVPVKATKASVHVAEPSTEE